MEDGIKIDLKDVEWGVDWTDVSEWGQVIGFCEHGYESSVPIQRNEFLE